MTIRIQVLMVLITLSAFYYYIQYQDNKRFQVLLKLIALGCLEQTNKAAKE